MIEQPLVSIVITAYDTERLQSVFELLDSIKSQTYPNVETIVVIERSRELEAKVRDYGESSNLPRFEVLFNDGEPGASAARNLGIERARGDIIAFIDDDAVAHPDWAERMSETFRDNTVIGVTGPALPLWQDTPVLWFPEEFYWVFSCTAWTDWDKVTEVRNVWTMNASFRRDALVKAGLFSPVIGPRGGSMAGRKKDISEDLELSLRLREVTGKRIVYNPRVKVQHRVDPNRLKMNYIVRWSYWLGYSKKGLKKNTSQSQNGNSILTPERTLLKRIFTRLFPGIMVTFFTHPVIAWRKLSVTVTVLVCVAAGYYSNLFLSFRRYKT